MTIAAMADELGKTTAGHIASWLAIVSAGEKVIADKGFARATVEDIAEAAKISTDVFYAHFQGKGALLRALDDRYVERVCTTVDQATRSGSWTDPKTIEPRGLAFLLLLTVRLGHQAILVGEDWSGVAFSREELAREAARAIAAYLGLDTEEAAAVSG